MTQSSSLRQSPTRPPWMPRCCWGWYWSVTGWYLLAHDDESLTPGQAARFADFVERRAAGEPVAHILGRRAFYDRALIVTPDVLIPRPETEILLEAALDFAKTMPNCVAADIGTGSGALAVTFTAHVPQAQVYAIDISPQALAVARRNAETHNTDVTFYEGDLLGPLIDHNIKVNVLMANSALYRHGRAAGAGCEPTRAESGTGRRP